MKRSILVVVVVVALLLAGVVALLKHSAESPSVFTESTSVSSFHADSLFVVQEDVARDAFVVYANGRLMEYNARLGEDCVVHAIRIGHLADKNAGMNDLIVNSEDYPLGKVTSTYDADMGQWQTTTPLSASYDVDRVPDSSISKIFVGLTARQIHDVIVGETYWMYEVNMNMVPFAINDMDCSDIQMFNTAGETSKGDVGVWYVGVKVTADGQVYLAAIASRTKQEFDVSQLLKD